MLVLSRKHGEEIVIDGTIRLTVLSTSGSRVKLGIQAPSDIAIRRAEIGPPSTAVRPPCQGNQSTCELV